MVSSEKLSDQIVLDFAALTYSVGGLLARLNFSCLLRCFQWRIAVLQPRRFSLIVPNHAMRVSAFLPNKTEEIGWFADLTADTFHNRLNCPHF